MTTKEKIEIRQRSFCDGVETNSRVVKRVVYTKKDGTRFIRDSLKGEMTLLPGAAGMLEVHFHAKTIVSTPFDQILKNLQKKANGQPIQIIGLFDD